MPFFFFHQNNSGGHFDFIPNKGITTNVIIEAKDYAHALARAEEIGLYFGGVMAGTDCDCCGDRWSPPWDEKGDDAPLMYGEHVLVQEIGATDRSYVKWQGEGEPEVFIHYLDGTIMGCLSR